MHYNEEMIYVKQILEQIRQDHPTLSCRAIYYKVNPVSIGRDKFERMCKEMGFTVERHINPCRTTNSNGVIRFDNLLIGIEITSINQVWSSDITYYDVKNIFYYLTFILDNYSRKIVGYSVSSRLKTEHTTLVALKRAIKLTGKEVIKKSNIILHSDGGGQYYDKNFLALTKEYNFKNSMCEYAYENGKAERINGIIKNNYLRHKTINTVEELIAEVDRTIQLYNSERPHKSLKYKTPLEVEKEILSLQQQTQSTTKESFDKKRVDLGASCPYNPKQTQSQIQDVISKKDLEIYENELV
jgi:putative transposase